MRRVVVTGMGMVSPFGMGVDHTWTQLIQGKSGIRAITHIDVSDMASRIAGVVPTPDMDGDQAGVFHADHFMDPKDQRKSDRFIVYGMAAAHEAIENSGWTPSSDAERERAGVLIGSGIGGLQSIFETSETLIAKGPRRLSPFSVPAMLINLASGHVSIRWGLKGPNHSVVTACASGAHAIGDAARLIMWDDADVMIAGGAEAAVNRLGIGSFAAARALSTGYNDRPTQASRPFDRDRDGFVIGEGAGVVVLEEYEHAKKRGATILAEIVGYGLSGDAYHITSPAEDGNGGYRAMQAALKRANIGTDQVDYINAHGTSTPVGDGIEAGAVKRLFANDLDHVVMSSTKSAIGHLLGAAGAVEAIFCIQTMRTGIIPPTLNLHAPSDEVAGLNLSPLVATEKQIRYALSNSFGFGGTNASLVLKNPAL